MVRLLLSSLIVAAVVIPGLVLVANADQPDVQRPDDLYFADFITKHAAPTTSGPDAYGFDYANCSFDGYLANLYLGALGLEPYTGDSHTYAMAHPTIVRTWFWEHRDVRVSLTWNDTYLSTIDADGDGWLDRGMGKKGYVGSGAWATLHLDAADWTYQARLIAAPKGSVEDAGAWKTVSGTEIGPAVWDGFAASQIAISGDAAGPAGAALLAHMP